MTVEATDTKDVGKGTVGAVTSVVGRMGGRNVVICRSLASMRRGAITYADGIRLAEAADQARHLRIPFVFIVASSGADVGDGVAALHGWGRAAAAIARCSGVVPIIAAATGPVVSGPALLLGMSDLVVMNSEAVAFVSGPQMVEEFTVWPSGSRSSVGSPRTRRRAGCAPSNPTTSRVRSANSWNTCRRTPTRFLPSSPLSTRSGASPPNSSRSSQSARRPPTTCVT